MTDHEKHNLTMPKNAECVSASDSRPSRCQFIGSGTDHIHIATHHVVVGAILLKKA